MYAHFEANPVARQVLRACKARPAPNSSYACSLYAHKGFAASWLVIDCPTQRLGNQSPAMKLQSFCKHQQRPIGRSPVASMQSTIKGESCWIRSLDGIYAPPKAKRWVRRANRWAVPIKGRHLVTPGLQEEAACPVWEMSASAVIRRRCSSTRGLIAPGKGPWGGEEGNKARGLVTI